MRAISIFLGFVSVSLLAIPAVAQSYERLDSAELKATLYGVELVGQTARSGVPWSKCVSPDGEIVYDIDGEEQRGTLRITDDARACFVYPQGPRCFEIYENGDHHLMVGTEDFKIEKIKSGVSSC